MSPGWFVVLKKSVSLACMEAASTAAGDALPLFKTSSLLAMRQISVIMWSSKHTYYALALLAPATATGGHYYLLISMLLCGTATPVVLAVRAVTSHY
jgi:hypothetical protein